MGYIVDQLLFLKNNVIKFELEAIEDNFINIS